MAPRRTLLASLLSSALAASGLAVVLVGATAPAAGASTALCSGGSCTVTFDYTGAVETWTVPLGVTSISAVVEGAGRIVYSSSLQGGGGRSGGTIAVSPGDQLSVVVGGTNGYGGGGSGGPGIDYGGVPGAGGSFLAVNGVLALVAGGGGGTGWAGPLAPSASSGGGNGGSAVTPPTGGPTPGSGGAASATAHGAAGGGNATAGSGAFSAGPPVVLPRGGSGGSEPKAPCYDPDGCPTTENLGGGGGGGGYFAGGGGQGLDTYTTRPAGGGGGGSGYAAASVTNVTGTSGVRDGNGRIVLTFDQQVAQTITFTSTAPTAPALGSSYDVTATGGGSGNPVVFSVVGTPAGSCTITGSRVSFVHAGTCVISADQAGAAPYAAASTKSQTVTVPKVDQSIAFVPPNDAKVGGSRVLAPTGGGSGNPVVIEAPTTSQPNGCSVSGSTVTYLRAGMCALTISQAGSADYNPATTLFASFLIGKGSQTITGLSLPGSPRVGDTAVLAATGGGSSQAVSYATSSTACTVTGSTVSFVHVGTCAVTASQGADADYTAATDVSASTTVAKKLQAITFSLPSAARVGGSVALSATASEGGVVTYAAGGDAGVCRIAGGSVVYDHVGTCTVTASQAGTADVEAAPQVSQSVVVGQGLQSISFTVPGTNRVGGERALTATGGASGQPVTYAVGSGTTNDACVIRGGNVVFQHAGTCVVTADQAGTDDYEPAATARQVVPVEKGFALLRVGTIADTQVGAERTLQFSSASPGAIVASSTRPAVCTVTGSTVRTVHVGNCVVEVEQAETDDYLPGSTGLSFAVSQGSQVITGFAPGASGTVGGSVDLAAVGGASGNAVTFAVSPDTTNGACTVSGVRLMFVHAGSCVVTADQAGSTDYVAASQVKRTIAVGRAPQTISGFQLPGSAPIGFQAVLTATGGPGGAPVVFAIGAGTTPRACRIVAGAVVTERAGTCVVTADQAGGADFEPATQVVRAFAVVRNTQSLVFTLPASAPLGGSAALAVSGGVGGSTVRFSVDPATTNDACVIDGSTVRFVHGGTCVVAASDPGDADTDPARVLASTVVQRAATVTSVSVTGTGLRAVVRSGEASLGTPSGVVEFLLDGTLVGTAPLDADGLAVLELVVPNGEHQIVARYLGDGDFAAGVGDYATSSGEVVRTDPVITATVTSTRRISRSGWYRGPVTVTFVCAPGSGVLVGSCPAPVVIKRSTKGRVVTRTIRAEDGGSATVSTVSLRVDLKRPKVRVKGIAAGKPRCVAKDRVSGVASCRVEVRHHGARTVYIAIAKDVAGNTARVRKVIRD